MSFKAQYSRFFAAHSARLHCAPHSHHYWPDVTREAQLAYWDDSARGVDHKWDQIFGERVPAVQRQLAELLSVPDPSQFVFAANTHELLYRVLSCFDPAQPLSILTTDSEFHSFSRQVRRLSERPTVKVQVVPTEPFDTFATRWLEAVKQHQHQLIFASQVFYNSGVIGPELTDWIAHAHADATIVVDGYHGCGAIPTSLANVADRIFYVAGSYKYLQAGEGCCFMTVPRNCTLRPEYTGWFADFANLAKPQQAQVEYASDGFRFAGATMDYTALYRLQAVLDWWQKDGITVTSIHAHVQQLQQAFRDALTEAQHPLLQCEQLLHHDLNHHGHFYTYRLPTAEQVTELAAQLDQRGIATDYRANRLRFGFAMYHDVEDFALLRDVLMQLKA